LLLLAEHRRLHWLLRLLLLLQLLPHTQAMTSLLELGPESCVVCCDSG
jgi:hypothetical protein